MKIINLYHLYIQVNTVDQAKANDPTILSNQKALNSDITDEEFNNLQKNDISLHRYCDKSCPYSETFDNNDDGFANIGIISNDSDPIDYALQKYYDLIVKGRPDRVKWTEE